MFKRMYNESVAAVGSAAEPDRDTYLRWVFAAGVSTPNFTARRCLWAIYLKWNSFGMRPAGRQPIITRGPRLDQLDAD